MTGEEDKCKSKVKRLNGWTTEPLDRLGAGCEKG